ncbi:MAG: 23S rRNA (uracil(1939)-C(5))-methyltransferase RlmD [Gammaproteobacteria bacterium]|nr:23S rRNA (uracil(1939)-C(5))-methyltransferase RlmD [Gammaproteobacteria bacterium]
MAAIGIVKAGGEGETLIEALSHEAAGVAHHDGKAVFIDGALPRERVRFRYEVRKRHYDLGHVTEILEASADRIEPPCAHFGICGGCRLQHMAPAAQVRAKEQIVRETLWHVGQVDAQAWAPPLTGPTLGYRRKARLGVRVVPKKGGVLVGFRERNHSFIVPLTSCLTLESRVGNRLEALRELISGLSIAARLPQIEYAGGEEGAALVFRHLEPLAQADEDAIRVFGARERFDVYSQAAGPESISPLAPARSLFYTLPAFDVRLQFAPHDFVQVNGEVNRAMVSQALEWLDLNGSERVIDLFCGLGNFTLPLARRAHAVTGVEANEALVAQAGRNAAANGLTGVRFVAADLDAAGVATVIGAQGYDAALLDPPRTGALGAVRALAAQGVPRLLYVSCNPATLARDAQVLVHQWGYTLVRAGVLDMFPHTHHIESMALFVREVP